MKSFVALVLSTAILGSIVVANEISTDDAVAINSTNLFSKQRKPYKVRDIFKEPFYRLGSIDYEKYRNPKTGEIELETSHGKTIVPCKIPSRKRFLLQAPRSLKYISIDHITTGRIGERRRVKTRWDMQLSKQYQPNGLSPFKLYHSNGIADFGHPDYFGAYKQWNHYPAHPGRPKPGHKRKYAYQATLVEEKYGQKFVAFCYKHSISSDLSHVFLHMLNSKWWLGSVHGREFPLYFDKTPHPSTSFKFKSIKNTVVLP